MEEKILRMKSGKVYRLEGKAQTLMGMPIGHLIEEWINHSDKIIIFEDSEHRNLYRDWETDRKSTRLNSSHSAKSRMPSSA